MVNVDDLKKCGNDTYDEGYRLVFFYKDGYRVGAWASELKNFMYEFVEVSPIESEEDIPKFISDDDILNRCLKQDKKLKKVAIYTIEGELVQEKRKND